MTRKQRDTMKEAHVSPALMRQIDKYVKDKCRVASVSRKLSRHQADELIDDVLSYLEEKKDATIEDIVNHFGSPKYYAECALETQSDHEVEKVKQRITVRKIVLITAVIVVTIVGIVYAGALIENHFIANGFGEETIQDIEEVIIESDGGY